MRCFIGIPVPPALAATLTANPVPPTARPVPAANLHLTLAFLGERIAYMPPVTMRPLYIGCAVSPGARVSKLARSSLTRSAATDAALW